MGKITVGVIKERTPGERRVALVPESVGRLQPAGIDVFVESGAGRAASFPDGAYGDAGAKVGTRNELYESADIVACVRWPDDEEHAALRSGQVLVGMLEPLFRPEIVRRLATRGVTAVSLDMVPRTLSRAQTLDVLSSQANVAGYKAAVLAADAFGRYFPMLTTAAGTSTPAAVLVLGAGVAGLQAIGTAGRLGAVVTGYDIRPEARGEIESLGARFLKLTAVESGGGSGGYARELTADERRAQQDELDQQIGRFDVVITTAQVPGRRPPVLVTARALEAMRPGSVVIDMAAGERGGNVEGSAPDQSVVLDNGVTVIGAGNLPSAMAPSASAAYARNLGALLNELITETGLTFDLADEVLAAVVVTHGGAVVNREVASLLDDSNVEEK